MRFLCAAKCEKRGQKFRLPLLHSLNGKTSSKAGVTSYVTLKPVALDVTKCGQVFSGAESLLRGWELLEAAELSRKPRLISLQTKARFRPHPE
jgi:hypothetical protein